ncbi:MAG: transglutaminase-like cysteine peptidase [Pseudomonadota bacterium]
MRIEQIIHKAARATAACVALAGALGSTSAHATVIGTLVQPAFAAAAIQTTCPLGNPLPSAVATSARAAKGSAILGGEMSALERMKAQQAGQVVEIAKIEAADALREFQPAAGGVRSSSNICSLFSAKSRIDIAAPFPSGRSNNDFLATKRVSIQKTSFDKDWARVYRETLPSSFVSGTVRNLADPSATLRDVNRWVNNRITYVEDRVLFDEADYWAGARLTLALGMGDCEDIALAKMQLLAAAGFRREDMFLTIAKDTLRRSDHALLVVKLKDRFVVLDNTTDALLDGAKAHDYRPILSFSERRAWVHGY